MELDLKVKYGELLDLYANLLTDKQVKQMEEYMLYDLSLTEIAQNNNSSRQAVYDAIQKTMQSLDDFEKKLHLLEKKNKLISLISSLQVDIDKKRQLLDILNN